MIKSQYDKNIYDYIELNNQLKCLIINNTNFTHSTCCLTVQRGGEHDIVPGSSHLLEHVLLMGSNKYPEYDYFTNFIINNEGDYNAVTSHDKTYYYFTIINSKFIDALSIFSELFIHPTLTIDNTQIEISAVNSEFINSASNIYIKMNSILYDIDQSNTFGKFICGNTASLNIPNINSIVKQQFDQYSSDIMNLCVASPIKNISNIIMNIFDKIPNKNLSDNNNKNNNNKNNNKQFNKTPNYLINACLTKNKINGINLSLNWKIPRTSDIRKYNIFKVILYILNRKSKDSLYDILSLKYDLSLHANNNSKTKEINLLQINVQVPNIDQTKEIENDIINTVINYVHFLTTQNLEPIYNEIREKDKIQFLFDTDITTDDIIRLSYDLRKIKPKNLLKYGFIYRKWNSKIKNIFDEFFSYVKQNNMYVIINDFDLCYNPNALIESLYDVHYNYKELTINNVNFNNDNHFVLPSFDPFISKDLNVNSYQDTQLQLLNNQSWYAFSKFETIQTSIYFNLYVNSNNNNNNNNNVNENNNYELHIQKLILHDLLLKLFEKNMLSNYVILNFKTKYLEVIINGFNNNINLIFDQFINTINYLNNIDKNTFSNLIDKKKKYMIAMNNNIEFKNLYDVADDYIDDVLYSHPPISIKNDIIKNTTLDNITIDTNILYDLFIYRNILPENIQLNNIKIDKMNNNIIIDTHFKNIIINKNNTLHSNYGGISYYLFVDNNEENYIKYTYYFTILFNLISENFFTEMRNVQKLGYIVQVTYDITSFSDQLMLNYTFYSISPNYTSGQIIDKILHFLKSFDINNKTEQSLSRILPILINKFNYKFNTYYEEAFEKYINIIINNFSPNYYKKMSEYGYNIKPIDIIHFYNDFILNNNQKIIITIEKQN